MAQKITETRPPVDAYTKSIHSEYPDLFLGIGKIKDKTLSLHIDKSVYPKQQTYRRIPFHVRKDVEKAELKRLEDLDIIETRRSGQWFYTCVRQIRLSKGKNTSCLLLTN